MLQEVFSLALRVLVRVGVLEVRLRCVRVTLQVFLRCFWNMVNE